MGVVFQAYDPELDRKVAVKLLHADLSSSARRRERLMREAQAMARLKHPNVVTVHDVGTVDGKVYLTMELVDGQTLSIWLGQAQRTWRETVAVFVQAGRGLAAAHDKNLVHRDFKPDNVVVDSSGKPYVMDFGLARVDGTDVSWHSDDSIGVPPSRSSVLTSKLTAAGAVVGTPAYMAPEQLTSDPVDARTDQFSFCAALWEALFGQLPWRTVASSPAVAAINEAELAPPAGSNVPARIRKSLERGLQLNPDARWGSMNELLDDLGRDPTKKRIVMFTSAAVVLAGAAMWGVWKGQRAVAVAECERRAEEVEEVWNPTQRTRVEQALLSTAKSYAEITSEKVMPWLDRYAEQWAHERRTACIAFVEGRRDAALDDNARACFAERRILLQWTIDALAEGTVQALDTAVETAAGLPTVEPCNDDEGLRRESVVVGYGEAPQRVDAVFSELAQAKALAATSRRQEALAHARGAKAVADELGAQRLALSAALTAATLVNDTSEPERVYRELADTYFEAAKIGEESLAYAAAVELYRVTHSEDRIDEAGMWLRSADLHLREEDPRRRAAWLTLQAQYLRRRGDFEGAERSAQQALVKAETVYPPLHPVIAHILNVLSNALIDQGRFQESRELMERVVGDWESMLGEGHPAMARYRNNLSQGYVQSGMLDEAEVQQRKVIAIRIEALGEDHWKTGSARINLASTLSERGLLKEAEAEYRTALRILESARGPEHLSVGLALTNLGTLLDAEGRNEEALATHRRALKVLDGAQAQPDQIAASRINLGLTLLRLRRLDEAEEHFHEAVRILEGAKLFAHPFMAVAHHNLGAVFAERGEFARAEFHAREDLRINETTDHGPGDTAEARMRLGEVLLSLGRTTEALAELEQAYAFASEQTDPTPFKARVMFDLAKALEQSATDPTRARELAKASLELYSKQGSVDIADEVRRWIREHRP
jgi:tetratricopeptide (TPR) repeat protein